MNANSGGSTHMYSCVDVPMQAPRGADGGGGGGGEQRVWREGDPSVMELEEGFDGVEGAHWVGPPTCRAGSGMRLVVGLPNVVSPDRGLSTTAVGSCKSGLGALLCGSERTVVHGSTSLPHDQCESN
jgi:hypothetical protein